MFDFVSFIPRALTQGIPLLFGSTGAGHFLIACTVGLDRLKEAFDRMEGLSF